MINKVAYELVALREAIIFNNTFDIISAMDQSTNLLQYCGWSKEEYDKEMLYRIDIEWLNINSELN